MKNKFLPYKNVFIPLGKGLLHGVLTVPEEAKGLIVFVHGNGDKHVNPSSMIVTDVLNKNGFATFLFDLLTDKENLLSVNRLSTRELTERLIVATEWLAHNKEINGLKIGYYGESSGVIETMNAADKLGYIVKAVVTRGRKPEIILPLVEKVSAPVLVLVGGINDKMLEPYWSHNGKKSRKKRRDNGFSSNELYEEHRKLSLVAKISLGWFDKHLNNNLQNNKHKWF